MKNFFTAMLKCKDEIYLKRNRQSADIYLKVQSFVESGCYSTCKKAGEIAKLTLKGFDARELAEHFGRAYDTIRTEKRSISMSLWALFPSDFFEKLINYQENKQYIDDCIYVLDTFEIKADDVLFFDVVKDIGVSDCSGQSYNYSELQNELDFLSRYSRLFYESDKGTVDSNKLQYLIGVLNSTNKNTSLRAKVLGKLIGECK